MKPSFQLGLQSRLGEPVQRSSICLWRQRGVEIGVGAKMASATIREIKIDYVIGL